ncbi:MAG TPA: PQQ-binding-like beta-propeller repeat protein, partial [Pyrinomonadaceae bacterium]|nr:PQQ-binding-like beta-propeller repeat protein [Pyrinomonadaceae bacterium]
MRIVLAVLAAVSAVALGSVLLTTYSSRLTVRASDPGSGDWPMWGGTPDRNMVSNMKGIPVSWDVQKKTNIKWATALGSQTYGNPVVAGGQVYVGTNN